MKMRRIPSALSRGFTLVEMIAVLAIMAILASAIAPNIVAELKRARADAEDASLANMASLLSRGITLNRSVPGTNTWAAAVSALSDIPAPQIGTNQDIFPRVYVVDPGWLPGATLPSAAGWTQTPSASWALAGTTPSRCRVLLFSGVQQDLTAPCAGVSALQFDQIWNMQGGPAACQQGVNVRIARANFTSLFFQVTLTGSAPGAFTFDGALGARQVVPVGSMTFPVLSGTRLSLLDAAGTTVLAETVVNRALSATWNGVAWTTP